LIVAEFRQQQGEVQTGFVADDLGAFTECARQLASENFAALRVNRTHPADVTRKMAFADEFEHHRLGNMRRTEVHRLAHDDEAFHQIRRDNNVTEPQSRKHDLAETTDVNHAVVLIHSLQRRDRFSVVSILAVVIVLDNPGGGALRPFEQLQASRRAHGHA